MELNVGTVIGGRYRLDRLLGEGGMGAVWSATHTITGGRVALKFVKAAAEAKAEMRKRFEREARAATLVEHPNVVTIRDIFDHDDTPVIVMDLLHGETLAALLARVGRLPLGDVARLLLPVISAVGAAHAAGLIHRDLKPENVFLVRGTLGETVRVLDFGIAKLVRRDVEEYASTAVTQSGTLIGTPAYMAPEQLFGEKDLDYRVDVWAIGVMMFEMLAGERPVDGENFGQLAKKMLTQPVPSITEKCSDLPDEVVSLVTRLLARERDERLRDLHEAAAVLSRHTTLSSPSFGAPRERPITDSGEDRVVVGTGTDPNARTMEIASTKRRTDPSAETVLAPSAKHETATAHVASLRPAARSWQSLAIGGVALLAIGVVAMRLMQRAPSAPTSTPVQPVAASPTAVAMPTLSAPIPAPLAPTAPTATGAASVTSMASVTSTPSAKPPVKPPKSPVVATVATSVSPPTTIAPPPPPPPTATTGSGLVTKPPF